MGETSTRSNSASRAICKACLVGTTPMFPPSGPINRTSATRIPSLTRNSVALISFSYFKTVDQLMAGFWRTNDTMHSRESSIKRGFSVGCFPLSLFPKWRILYNDSTKQTVNDPNSSVAHGLNLFYSFDNPLAILFSLKIRIIRFVPVGISFSASACVTFWCFFR